MGAQTPLFKARFAIRKNYLTKAEEGSDEARKLWVEGYASHGRVDTYGDEISDDGLKDLASKMTDVVLLHNHDPDQQIGRTTETKFVEEEPAVWVKAWVALGKDEQLLDDPDSVPSKIMDGRIDAFSIHAYPGEYRIIDTAEEFRVIIDAWERVVELSMTSVPVQEGAKLLDAYVKAFGQEVRNMKTDELKKAVQQVLDNPEGPLGQVVTAAVKAAMKSETDAPADPPPDPSPEETPDDPPPEPDPDEAEPETPDEPEPKSVDAGAMAEFLASQAAALEGLEVEGDDAEVIANVASALKAQAEELKSEDDGDEDGDEDDDGEDADKAEKALKDKQQELERVKAEVDGLERQKADLLAAQSRQETPDEPPQDPPPASGDEKYKTFGGSMLNVDKA